MKKSMLFILTIISLSTTAQYVNSIGARGGLRGIGLTYKQYFAPNLFLNLDAVGTFSQELQGGELIGSLNVRNKIHNSNFQAKELTWSYGAGMHGGYYMDPDNTENESHLVLGPDLRLGAEYIVKQKWCLGIDLTGFYNIIPIDKVKGMDDRYYQVFGGGVFLRYIIQ